jgi:hypothetical protein
MILKQGTNRYFSNSVSLGKLTTLLEQLKIAKSVAEAKQFCTTDLDDFDFFE